MCCRILRILNMQQIGRHYYNPDDPFNIPQHRFWNICVVCHLPSVGKWLNIGACLNLYAGWRFGLDSWPPSFSTSPASCCALMWVTRFYAVRRSLTSCIVWDSSVETSASLKPAPRSLWAWSFWLSKMSTHNRIYTLTLLFKSLGLVRCRSSFPKGISKIFPNHFQNIPLQSQNRRITFYVQPLQSHVQPVQPFNIYYFLNITDELIKK